jgi:hypothetical protein
MNKCGVQSKSLRLFISHATLLFVTVYCGIHSRAGYVATRLNTVTSCDRLR